MHERKALQDIIRPPRGWNYVQIGSHCKLREANPKQEMLSKADCICTHIIKIANVPNGKKKEFLKKLFLKARKKNI